MERMDAIPGYGLIIGDKHLSSWSLQAWVLLRHFDLAFQEQVVRLDQPDTRQNILKFPPPPASRSCWPATRPFGRAWPSSS